MRSARRSSKQYRVIVYDRSGCGRSQKAREGYSIEAWTEELAGLLDHLDVPAALLVGHSLGSTVALRFAGNYPARTQALFLAGGEAELSSEAKHVLAERARTIDANGLGAVADAWLAGVLSGGQREANPALAGLVREMFLANDATTYAQALSGIARWSSPQRPGKHRLPNAPAGWRPGPGDASDVAAPDRRGHCHEPNSDHSKHAHMTMLESPAAFNTALLDFLATVET